MSTYDRYRNTILEYATFLVQDLNIELISKPDPD